MEPIPPKGKKMSEKETPQPEATQIPETEETPKAKFFTKSRIVGLGVATATAVVAAAAIVFFAKNDEEEVTQYEENETPVGHQSLDPTPASE